MKTNGTMKVILFVLLALACGIGFYLATNYAMCST